MAEPCRSDLEVRTDQILNESDSGQTIEIFDGFQDTQTYQLTGHGSIQKERQMTPQPLPYGIDDLDPKVVVDPDDRNRVRCYVRGCQNYVRRPTGRKAESGEPCPDHGIYCRHSKDATYVYEDACRNIIASADLFRERMLRHPFKFDSDVLGYEKSEDALSWNVFRSIQESGHLASLPIY